MGLLAWGGRKLGGGGGVRKALQALPPACSTAMGLERRAERSYRDGGGFSMPPSAPSICRMHPRRPPAPLHPPLPPPHAPLLLQKGFFLSCFLPSMATLLLPPLWLRCTPWGG